VRLRLSQRGERGLDSVQADGAGDERRWIDLAVGHHGQSVAEFKGRVAEHEPQVDLLVDGHGRREMVDADAHTGHHDP
jgi:hypothetical protein